MSMVYFSIYLDLLSVNKLMAFLLEVFYVFMRYLFRKSSEYIPNTKNINYSIDLIKS